MKFTKNIFSVVLFLMLMFLTVSTYGDEDKGRLYVVGMGPAGPDLTAPRALSIIEKADYFLTSPGMPERFEMYGRYIDPDKVAFNPWENILGNDSKTENPEARRAAREKQREKVQNFVIEKIKG